MPFFACWVTARNMGQCRGPHQALLDYNSHQPRQQPAWSMVRDEEVGAQLQAPAPWVKA